MVRSSAHQAIQRLSPLLRSRPRQWWPSSQVAGGPCSPPSAFSSSSSSSASSSSRAPRAAARNAPFEPPPAAWKRCLSARAARRLAAAAARRGLAGVPHETPRGGKAGLPGGGGGNPSSPGGVPGLDRPATSSPFGGQQAGHGATAEEHHEGARHAKQLLSQLDGLARVYRNVELSYRVLGAGAAVCALGAGYLIVNWSGVRKEVSRESAEVISATIRDENLQFTAREFSKELLNQLLHDDEIARVVATWIMAILVKLQEDIGALFVKILHQEQVVQAVNSLADKLVAYLCSNRTIQERVGQLLVDAICLDASRDAAAQWAVDLVMREDVTYGFRDLCVAALQTEAVISEAQSLAVGVLNRVLSDEETIAEARRALRETLRDAELRATAKESLWNIVMPWSSSKAPDKKRAVKSLDDVMALESLTQEERQVLKAIQARIRSGSSASEATERKVKEEAARAEKAEAQRKTADQPPEQKAKDDAGCAETAEAGSKAPEGFEHAKGGTEQAGAEAPQKVEELAKVAPTAEVKAPEKATDADKLASDSKAKQGATSETRADISVERPTPKQGEQAVAECLPAEVDSKSAKQKPELEKERRLDQEVERRTEEEKKKDEGKVTTKGDANDEVGTEITPEVGKEDASKAEGLREGEATGPVGPP